MVTRFYLVVSFSFFFFKQKTAYEVRISDWSSDVCSSDLNTHVKTRNATCMALATNQPINPLRNTPQMREMNQEQPFLAVYSYDAITDAAAGLLLVDLTKLAAGEFRTNKLRRAVRSEKSRVGKEGVSTRRSRWCS